MASLRNKQSIYVDEMYGDLISGHFRVSFWTFAFVSRMGGVRRFFNLGERGGVVKGITSGFHFVLSFFTQFWGTGQENGISFTSRVNLSLSQLVTTSGISGIS